MPVMTGLAATEHIMAHFPTPILIVSASTNRGELFKTYDALAAGAIDALDKPLGTDLDPSWERAFCSAVRMISRLKVITHPRAKLGAMGKAHSAWVAPRPSVASRGDALRAVGIGVSTGGPSAVLDLLSGLPPSFPIPLLLVIHITEPFGVAFAEWLDAMSPLRVAYAQDGEPLPTHGRVLMAPPDVHLTVEGDRLRLHDGPERHSCRPSVDVLFESMARELGGSAAGCLLTGMGRDGAAGLLAMRKAGARTFAQDEESSVVFGMPREAIALGAAGQVLPLTQFAPTLLQLAMGSVRGAP
jgi:two-component system chemotaxis response regulator CheB